jgi:ATP-dependent exoDNAse (exonuclease V) alpha subunit
MRPDCRIALPTDCARPVLRLAELGASDREIMAITGHQTAKEVDRYTKGARQRTLAASAMEKWKQGQNE